MLAAAATLDIDPRSNVTGLLGEAKVGPGDLYAPGVKDHIYKTYALSVTRTILGGPASGMIEILFASWLRRFVFL